MTADDRSRSAVPGYDAFLSYHWRDRVPVEDLARALGNRGLHVFLDRWYLTPGLPWPQKLETALRNCRAAVVCVGAGEMGPWQQREAYMALERQGRETTFPVIPALLPGAEPALGFLGQLTWVDLRAAPGDPAALAMLAGAIRGEPPGPDGRDHVARTLATVCPYRGLLYFREEDAPFFCGREAAIAGLVDAVGHGSLIAVVGASGCGKSSVVRAGLVPALRRDGARVWDVATFVPGARPFHRLAAGLLPLLDPDTDGVNRLIEVNKLAEALESGTVHLPEIVAQIMAKQAGTDRLLLVADQWEELYTLTVDEGVRRRLIDELLMATSASPLTVALTLRGDFVGHALAYRPLADQLQGAQVNIGPMVREELRRAVEQPAEKVGLRFAPGMVDRILDDAGDEPGNLPLLEFVLRQLWDRRQHGELQHEAYEDLGRLHGAVAKKADEVYAHLSELEKQAVQRVFLRLATPTEEGDYARRRAARSELGAGVLEVVKKLADERLLVTAPGAATAEETVEVSHEALLRRWGRLKGWLDGHREFLLWRRRFAELVATWSTGGKRDDALATGVFLDEAERWQREQGEQLSLEEREYIAASAARRRQEVEAERLRREQELASAQALAEAEAARAREAEARRAAEAARATEAEARGAAEAERAREAEKRAAAEAARATEAEARGVAETERAKEAEGRARALQRARRWTLVSAAFFLILAVGLAIAPARRWVARWSLGREVARDMVQIPFPEDGKFPMGCVGDKDGDCAKAEDEKDEKRHMATLPRRFDLMRDLVTVAQFRQYSDALNTPLTRQPKGRGEDSPVVYVGWEDARRFCDFVGGRLPTEAEWEYSARGGHDDWIYPWGDEEPSKEAVERPHGFGLRHMSGVVYQWTESIYANDPIDGPYDPASDEARVLRGGSLGFSIPLVMRASYRAFFLPGDRSYYLGFRCARDGFP